MPVIIGVCRRKQNSTNKIINDKEKLILKNKLNAIEDLKQLNYLPDIIEHYVKEFSNYSSVEESIEKV